MPSFFALIDSHGIDTIFSGPSMEEVQAVMTADKLRDEVSELGKMHRAVAQRINMTEMRARANPHRHPIRLVFEMSSEDYDLVMKKTQVKDFNPVEVVMSVIALSKEVRVLDKQRDALNKTLEHMEIEYKHR